MEKDSPSWRTTKSSFFSRSAHFGNVSSFLVGATNAFSELIHPFVKLPNCVQQPHILQFVQSPRLFRLSPSSRSRHRLCCRTATFTHFRSSTIYTTFHYIHYISQGSSAKNCFRNTESQRGRSCEQIFDSSTTFWNPLVGTSSLYGKRTVGFFSLVSHALRACEARALRARKTLTPRFTDFFY